MADHFARLGLPRHYTLDLAEVEHRYLEQSRAVHPDYHKTASETEQAASLALTAQLNEAYLALKDPYRRIEHLMDLAGGPTAGAVKNLDQAFLMESMEIRDRIDEGHDLPSIELELQERLSELLNAAGAPFDQGTPDAAALQQIRQKLNAAKTIMSLLRGLE